MSELYWISKTVVVDWPLKLLDGSPASTATVSGVVSKPDGTTDPMTVTWVAADLVWRATYDPTVEGWYAGRLTATGAADSAEEFRFYVKPSLVGGPPPELDPTTDIGKVRLFIADVDEDNLVFTDAQINAFIALNTGVKRAAAAALDVIASNEAMVSKVIKTQDRSTDGAKTADAIRKHAAQLRAEADLADETGEDAFFVDIVEQDACDPELAEPWIC